MRRLLTGCLIGICLSLVALLPAVGASAPAPVVFSGVYLSDVSAASGGLTRYGNILQNANGTADVKRQVKALRKNLRTFDQRVYVMSRYRLAEATLNRQRARLAATGAPLSVSLSDFVDAVILEKTGEVNRLAKVISRQTAAFRQAAGQ